ncbi:MAG: SPW repeat protein [Thermoanaerobaculia bacterium]
MAQALSRSNRIAIGSGIELLIGIWLFSSPYILGYQKWHLGATSNNAIVGIVITIFSAIPAFGLFRDAWLGWVTIAAGIWLILAPFVLGYFDDPMLLANSIIAGVLVTIFATMSALASAKREEV